MAFNISSLGTLVSVVVSTFCVKHEGARGPGNPAAARANAKDSYDDDFSRGKSDTFARKTPKRRCPKLPKATQKRATPLAS